MRVLIDNFFSIFKKAKAVELNPDSEGINVAHLMKVFQEGEKLNNENQYKEAILKFDIVISEGYGIFQEAYSQRGMCLQYLDFHLDAIDDFTKAIGLFPSDANNFFCR